jgi:hypothetical protein
LDVVAKNVIAAGVVAVLACGPAPALASDYFHECRSPDGRFEISDGVLVEVHDPQRKPIAYTVVAESVLSERRGYCLSAGGKHNFEARSYVQTIRFRQGDNTVETRVLCEIAADGLPAAYRCEKEVVTHAWTADGAGSAKAPTPAVAPAGPTVWLHNGSLVRLEASGGERRFVYERPRKGMIEAGARAGDPVFEGRRLGDTYSGQAYVFSRNCGRTPYEVSGKVAQDNRSVELEGQLPLLGADCKARGYRRDVLRFTLATD